MPDTPDVFSPAKLGPVTLRNRVIKAATFESRTPDALVTDDLIEYHRLAAAGGGGGRTGPPPAPSPGGRPPGRQPTLDAPGGTPRSAPPHSRDPCRARGSVRADRPRRSGRQRKVQ